MAGANTNRDTLYYDGACGMCRGSVRRLRRLDWLNRLDFQDSTRLDDSQLPVSREDAMHRIPMLCADGRVLSGYFALRRALRRTPLGLLPALLLYIPGAGVIGQRVYDAIARRRARGGACEIQQHSET